MLLVSAHRQNGGEDRNIPCARDTVSAPGSGRGFVGSLRDDLPLATTVFARPRRDTRPLAGATARLTPRREAWEVSLGSAVAPERPRIAC